MILRITLLSLTLALGACSTADDENSSDNLPTKVGNKTTELPGTHSGFGLNSGTTINVDLDQPSTGSAFACRSPLPADFVIGLARCVGSDTDGTPFTAGQTTQTCSNPNVNDIDPTSNFALTGCSEIKISVYKFSPAITTRIIGLTNTPVKVSDIDDNEGPIRSQ